MSEAVHLPLVTIAGMADLLKALVADTPGVTSATLASLDGLTVASTLSSSRDADRISAMASSMGGLAAAMTQESGHGVPHRMILESSRGLIVTLGVPRPSGEMVLTVVTDTRTVLGKLLWSCRQEVGQLAVL